MPDIKETIEIPASVAPEVFGKFDSNVRQIEDSLGVRLTARDGVFSVFGEEKAVHEATAILRELAGLTKKGGRITKQTVSYALEADDPAHDSLLKMEDDIICHTVQGKPIKPKTSGQQTYVQAIKDHMITFAIGPAGTGKTYLAMAMACTLLREGKVSRLILTRPAIEAGEKLGFLPGDLQSKVDPYLRPLYDALYQIMGAETFLKNQEKGIIEVAPLAYMRGRTLDNAFIILDEAQNATPAQMKMFLTRIGFGSVVVVTGDDSQVDLPKGQVSGLSTAVRILSKIDEIAFIRLSSVDVVRHPLVQKIVRAYDEYEKKAAARTKTSAKRKTEPKK